MEIVSINSHEISPEASRAMSQVSQNLSKPKNPQPTSTNSSIIFDSEISSKASSQVPYALRWTEHKLEFKPAKHLQPSEFDTITRNPFPLEKHSCSAIPTASQEWLIFGGGAPGSVPSCTNDTFLLSTDEWSLTYLETYGAMPSARKHHGAAIIGRVLVVFGGNITDSYLYFLNIDTRNWSKFRPPSPFPVSHGGISFKVMGYTLWLYGGSWNGQDMDGLWCLKLENFNVTGRASWKQLSKRNPWPSGRSFHSAICYGSSIYIFGGESYQERKCLNDLWEFNTDTECWTEIQCSGTVPPARSGHSATIIGDNMFIFGGVAQQGDTHIRSDEAFVFNISGRIWASLGMLGESPPPTNCGVLLAIGSRLAVVGGNTSNNLCIQVAETHGDRWLDSLTGLHFTMEATNLKFKTEPVDLSRFVRKQGEGAHALAGFSDVWRGEMIETGEPITIKVLRVSSTGNPDDPESGRLRKRFDRELTIWMECQHPRVIELLGYAYIEGVPCLISPWCSKGNIMEFLSKNPDADRRPLINQVAEGLVYLHGREPPVVHSDIKPGNVLVSDKGDAKICDFGISKLMQENPSGFTTTASVKGTLRYSSPEMLDQDGQSTTNSDVWAFGMLLLHVMTNKPPYVTILSDVKVILAIMTGITPEPVDYAELPTTDPYWGIMRECWDENPVKRPTMAEVLDKLQKCGGREET